MRIGSHQQIDIELVIVVLRSKKRGAQIRAHDIAAQKLDYLKRRFDVSPGLTELVKIPIRARDPEEGRRLGFAVPDNALERQRLVVVFECFS